MNKLWIRCRWFALAVAACNFSHNASLGIAAGEVPTPEAAAMQAEEPSLNPIVATPRSSRTIHRNAIVVFGKDVLLKSNETAEAVVVIGGSARIEGRVREAVVAIGGDIAVSGEVGDAVVAVMGGVELSSGAKVRRDVVAVGGTVDVPEGAIVEGKTQEVSVGGFGLPKLTWLREWLRECVFKCRPLAPQVGWVWWANGAFLLVYLLIALAFPGAVQACVNQLNNRPATTFLGGLVIKLLVPLVIGVLAITGIGLLGVPFLSAAMLLAKLFGKVALFIYLGQQLVRPFTAGGIQNRLGAFAIGWILVTLLYMVPFLGLFTFVVLGTWALGTAVMAAIGRSRHEAPPRGMPLAPVPPPPDSTFASPVPPAMTSGAVATPAAPAFSAPPPPANPHRVPPTLSSGSPLGLPDALVYPRATFWLRAAAGFVDLALILAVSLVLIYFLHVAGALEDRVLGNRFVTSWLGGDMMFPIWATTYFTAMWAWRGTTVGGVVTKLKVVRLDGQPVGVAVGLVRALSAWFSALALFLGFFWILLDKEQQGWHDRIAGTVVVRLPHSVPLV